MAVFEEIISTLKAGGLIRRNHWDEGTKLFIDNDGELKQQATGAPYVYSLDGCEISATDWTIA